MTTPTMSLVPERDKHAVFVFEPTDEHRKHVETLAGYGLTHDQISKLIVNPQTGKPIDRNTLAKHFREELDKGIAVANAAVAQSLFRKAIGNGPTSVTAAIFWLKARAGWVDRQTVELTGANGGPIELSSVKDSLVRGTIPYATVERAARAPITVNGGGS